ncbi:flagellar export chaperone FliS [Mangrovibacter yixingensis]|uniref:flagellar export chaperone FliS n=1 Tax=Mangrovibacter yixingensis TaxID=1529639 RepID=UPI001CF937F6|nr:flagellar export chaperone FliS [Mangrovibacter yixingensis]
MYNRSGVKAYQQVGLESAVMSASPHQLIVLLFDGALSALIKAKFFISQGEIEKKGAALSHCINIIDSGLKAGLDLEDADELTLNLASLYDYMTRRLLHANLHNDVAAIEEVERLLTNIADAWKQVKPSYQPLQGAS